MATSTTNLNLSKPAYTDPADIAVINDNMDKLDGAVNGVEDGLAIMANGNTHAAVAAGQFVYVRHHSREYTKRPPLSPRMVRCPRPI